MTPLQSRIAANVQVYVYMHHIIVSSENRIVLQQNGRQLLENAG
jgi:hypothetical protein